MCNVHLMSVVEFSYTLPLSLTPTPTRLLCFSEYVLIYSFALIHSPTLRPSLTHSLIFMRFTRLIHSIPFRSVPSICLFAILLRFINCYHIIKPFYVLLCVLYCRAVSHITGFVIRQQRNGGCRVGYIAHCDPQGTLPPWLVNKVTHSLGPRMVKDLRKAALGYKKWKNGQTHHRKPWRFPEEIITPRISILDVS